MDRHRCTAALAESVYSGVAYTKMQRAAIRILCSWFAIALSIPAIRAGEWVVETHSLNVKAPAAIAGVEEAAIGDVRVTDCLRRTGS